MKQGPYNESLKASIWVSVEAHLALKHLVCTPGPRFGHLQVPTEIQLYKKKMCFLSSSSVLTWRYGNMQRPKEKCFQRSTSSNFTEALHFIWCAQIKAQSCRRRGWGRDGVRGGLGLADVSYYI